MILKEHKKVHSAIYYLNTAISMAKASERVWETGFRPFNAMEKTVDIPREYRENGFLQQGICPSCGTMGSKVISGCLA